MPSILAGIITNTGLYTVNLAVMGFSSNVPMLKTQTIFTMAQALFGDVFPYKLLVAAVITVVVCLLLILFLGTRMGLSIRATGDNPDMVRASSINTAFTITIGLCISNAMTSLSGAVLAQYQKSADINLGTGMVVIDLASLIEEKINAMDVMELETMVLSVMKKELNTIVNLGALIGLVIGVLNIFI